MMMMGKDISLYTLPAGCIQSAIVFIHPGSIVRDFALLGALPQDGAKKPCF